jgi:hypothetical protein
MRSMRAGVSTTKIDDPRAPVLRQLAAGVSRHEMPIVDGSVILMFTDWPEYPDGRMYGATQLQIAAFDPGSLGPATLPYS